MNARYRHWWLLALLSVLTGCWQEQDRGYEIPDEVNAVYYWRTELKLDSTERAFLG